MLGMWLDVARGAPSVTEPSASAEEQLPLFPDRLPDLADPTGPQVVRFSPPRKVATSFTPDRRHLPEWLLVENGQSRTDPVAWVVHPPHALAIELIGEGRAAECWSRLLDGTAFDCTVGARGIVLNLDTYNVELSIGVHAVEGRLSNGPLALGQEPGLAGLAWVSPVLVEPQPGPSRFDAHRYPVTGPTGWQAERRSRDGAPEWVWVTFPPPAFVREMWGAAHWSTCVAAFEGGQATTCRVEVECGSVALNIDGTARLELRNACLRGAWDDRPLKVQHGGASVTELPGGVPFRSDE